ncbi:thiamine phosphate synthase [Chelatococcus sp. GCM10030263]|uniref:thiamine phosphate synthase n=1 Tax=Chelatococcus sp. GCM10030263 TaxID=3273387 RepID=UPI0036214E04
MTSPLCRLSLVTPVVDDPDAFAPVLAAACASGNVAAVLLKLGAMDERRAIKAVKTLAPIAQEAGAALIVAAPEQIAVRGGADGAHVDMRGGKIEVLDDAVSQLKPQWIVGVGGLGSRHAAMEAGERDVDYIMFGEPRPDGSLPDFAGVLERASWWAEIFALPCVAFAPSLAEIGPLAAARVEFVGLGDAVWSHPAGPAAAIEEAAAIVAAAASVRP